MHLRNLFLILFPLLVVSVEVPDMEEERGQSKDEASTFWAVYKTPSGLKNPANTFEGNEELAKAHYLKLMELFKKSPNDRARFIGKKGSNTVMVGVLYDPDSGEHIASTLPHFQKIVQIQKNCDRVAPLLYQQIKEPDPSKVVSLRPHTEDHLFYIYEQKLFGKKAIKKYQMYGPGTVIGLWSAELGDGTNPGTEREPCKVGEFIADKKNGQDCAQTSVNLGVHFRGVKPKPTLGSPAEVATRLQKPPANTGGTSGNQPPAQVDQTVPTKGKEKDKTTTTDSNKGKDPQQGPKTPPPANLPANPAIPAPADSKGKEPVRTSGQAPGKPGPGSQVVPNNEPDPNSPFNPDKTIPFTPPRLMGVRPPPRPAGNPGDVVPQTPSPPGNKGDIAPQTPSQLADNVGNLALGGGNDKKNKKPPSPDQKQSPPSKRPANENKKKKSKRDWLDIDNCANHAGIRIRGRLVGC